MVVLDTSDPSWTCTLRWTWPSVSVVDNVVVQVPGQACRTPWRWGSPSGSLDEVYIRAPTCCMDRVWGIQFRVSPTTEPHVVLLGWLVPRLSHGSFSSLVYTASYRPLAFCKCLVRSQVYRQSSNRNEFKKITFLLSGHHVYVTLRCYGYVTNIE